VSLESLARSPTLAPQGVVASSHALASEAGVDVLRSGGSAIDAAIAANAVLAVAYPHMAGLGGDAFWLIYDAKELEVRALVGAGRAPAAATLTDFQRRGLEEIPTRSLLAVTVPGAVDSWAAAHRSYGRLSFGRFFEAAITYAREGVPVTARLRGWTERTLPVLRAWPMTARIFLPGGDVPQVGAAAGPTGPRPDARPPRPGWAGRVLRRRDRGSHRVVRSRRGGVPEDR
jgi:gamma-glutamyltranspeptidase